MPPFTAESRRRRRRRRARARRDRARALRTATRPNPTPCAYAAAAAALVADEAARRARRGPTGPTATSRRSPGDLADPGNAHVRRHAQAVLDDLVNGMAMALTEATKELANAESAAAGRA